MTSGAGEFKKFPDPVRQLRVAWRMNITILCPAGDFERGVPAQVVESGLGWLHTGDAVGFQVAGNGTTWLSHGGHAYQFALHGLSDVVAGQQVLLLGMVN